MNLRDTIQSDFKSAFKNKEKIKISTLKMLRAEINNAEIAKRPDVLTDEDVLVVLKRAVKKRLQAAEIYDEAMRTELAEQERAELEVLKQYLPEE